MSSPLSDAWNDNAADWIRWARSPDHDSYWTFHRRRFLEMVPAPGRVTVDVGCGEGRVGRDLMAHGHTVVGLDSSPVLAHACATHVGGHPVAVADAAHLPVGNGCVDLVVGFMSFHDIDDLTGALAEAARILGPSGRLHLAIVHPINSAGAFGPGETQPPFVIQGSYLDDFRYADGVERDGLPMTFHSRHRPLMAYTRALAASGFVIENIEEVTDETSTKWSRIPLFMHLIARLR